MGPDHGAVHVLCSDAQHWLDNDVYGTDEAAARFHHQLTYIHPFPNGNGRHARLIADVLLESCSRPRFTWGRGDLHGPGDARDRYIAVLRLADANDFEPLLRFLQRD